MATRRVEVVVPSERVTELSKTMSEVSTAIWPESLGDGVSARVTAVVPTEAVEDLIANLE